MNRFIRCAAPVLVVLVFVPAGCNKSRVTMNDQVEGTATLDKKPLANVMVQFVPNLEGTVQAPQSSATTDEKGHFTLTCTNGKPGAVVGKHNVVVLVGRGGGNGPDDAPDAPAVRPSIPADYLRTDKTPLKIEVTADKHTYDLNLSSSLRPLGPSSKKDD